MHEAHEKLDEAKSTSNVTPEPGKAESFIRRLGISEAGALAALTALGYTYAFAYEYGYLSHFGIPFWVVDLSIVHVLVAVGALVAVVVTLMYVLPNLPPGPWWALGVHLLVVGSLVGMALIVATSTNWHHKREVAVAVLVGLPLAILALAQIRARLVGPIFWYKDKGSVLERWAYVINREKEMRKPDLLDHSLGAMERAGLRAYAWLAPVWVLLIAGPVVVQYLGLGAAYQQSVYVVVPTQPECVAARRYNDYIVCALFDRKSASILPAFRLIQLGDSLLLLPPACRAALRGHHLRVAVPQAVGPTLPPSAKIPRRPPCRLDSV